VLINNAGVAARKQYEMSKDGVEGHLQPTISGNFLLTNLIIDKVAKVKEVVINVSSMAYTLIEATVEDVLEASQPFSVGPHSCLDRRCVKHLCSFRIDSHKHVV